MLKQKELIARVKQIAESDVRISACMMYGSFTKGEGDQYSDVEFYVFLKDDMVPTFDSAKWLHEVAPYSLLYQNEYGTEVVIFENLIRGEFHFLSEKDMNIIPSFKETGFFPDTKAMFIYDETGQLEQYLSGLGGVGPKRLTEANVNFLFNNFSNLWLMGLNVLKRGEYARSLELLSQFQKNILQLIRVVEENADNWLNMTKNLEKEISTESYEKFRKTTARLKESELYDAYKNSLLFVMELRNVVEQQYMLTVSNDFLEKLMRYMNE
ncbi:MAG: lincosamide nucleotidyltransferase Lnu(B) [Paenibacillus sp.]|uniref:lincosamide nucleotidyltransferase Lnu(B) n=1 Tax=Paenibacillus sp. TaxID=58172 RepID=UPI002909E2AF|nr:lincosamide nucleotidyltransferase Lnu(B) [Paenibacillus sp.]MDU4695854.1 lincosamide nucleotidyltransferase Lnu(B) [Paenibacillus sp.]